MEEKFCKPKVVESKLSLYEKLRRKLLKFRLHGEEKSKELIDIIRWLESNTRYKFYKFDLTDLKKLANIPRVFELLEIFYGAKGEKRENFFFTHYIPILKCFSQIPEALTILQTLAKFDSQPDLNRLYFKIPLNASEDEILAWLRDNILKPWLENPEAFAKLNDTKLQEIVIKLKKSEKYIDLFRDLPILEEIRDHPEILDFIILFCDGFGGNNLDQEAVNTAKKLVIDPKAIETVSRLVASGFKNVLTYSDAEAVISCLIHQPAIVDTICSPGFQMWLQRLSQTIRAPIYLYPNTLIGLINWYKVPHSIKIAEKFNELFPYLSLSYFSSLYEAFQKDDKVLTQIKYLIRLLELKTDNNMVCDLYELTEIINFLNSNDLEKFVKHPDLKILTKFFDIHSFSQLKYLSRFLVIERPGLLVQKLANYGIKVSLYIDEEDQEALIRLSRLIDTYGWLDDKSVAMRIFSLYEIFTRNKLIKEYGTKISEIARAVEFFIENQEIVADLSIEEIGPKVDYLIKKYGWRINSNLVREIILLIKHWDGFVQIEGKLPEVIPTGWDLEKQLPFLLELASNHTLIEKMKIVKEIFGVTPSLASLEKIRDLDFQDADEIKRLREKYNLSFTQLDLIEKLKVKENFVDECINFLSERYKYTFCSNDLPIILNLPENYKEEFEVLEKIVDLEFFNLYQASECLGSKELINARFYELIKVPGFEETPLTLSVAISLKRLSPEEWEVLLPLLQLGLQLSHLQFDSIRRFKVSKEHIEIVRRIVQMGIRTFIYYSDLEKILEKISTLDNEDIEVLKALIELGFEPPDELGQINDLKLLQPYIQKISENKECLKNWNIQPILTKKEELITLLQNIENLSPIIDTLLENFGEFSIEWVRYLQDLRLETLQAFISLTQKHPNLSNCVFDFIKQPPYIRDDPVNLETLDQFMSLFERYKIIYLVQDLSSVYIRRFLEMPLAERDFFLERLTKTGEKQLFVSFAKIGLLDKLLHILFNSKEQLEVLLQIERSEIENFNSWYPGETEISPRQILTNIDFFVFSADPENRQFIIDLLTEAKNDRLFFIYLKEMIPKFTKVQFDSLTKEKDSVYKCLQLAQKVPPVLKLLKHFSPSQCGVIAQSPIYEGYTKQEKSLKKPPSLEEITNPEILKREYSLLLYKLFLTLDGFRILNQGQTSFPKEIITLATSEDFAERLEQWFKEKPFQPNEIEVKLCEIILSDFEGDETYRKERAQFYYDSGFKGSYIREHQGTQAQMLALRDLMHQRGFVVIIHGTYEEAERLIAEGFTGGRMFEKKGSPGLFAVLNLGQAYFYGGGILMLRKILRDSYINLEPSDWMGETYVVRLVSADKPGLLVRANSRVVFGIEAEAISEPFYQEIAEQLKKFYLAEKHGLLEEASSLFWKKLSQEADYNKIVNTINRVYQKMRGIYPESEILQVVDTYLTWVILGKYGNQSTASRWREIFECLTEPSEADPYIFWSYLTHYDPDYNPDEKRYLESNPQAKPLVSFLTGTNPEELMQQLYDFIRKRQVMDYNTKVEGIITRHNHLASELNCPEAAIDSSLVEAILISSESEVSRRRTKELLEKISAVRLELLRKAFNQAMDELIVEGLKIPNRDDFAIVVTSSTARAEAVINSDFDYLLLIRNQQIKNESQQFFDRLIGKIITILSSKGYKNDAGGMQLVGAAVTLEDLDRPIYFDAERMRQYVEPTAIIDMQPIFESDKSLINEFKHKYQEKLKADFDAVLCYLISTSVDKFRKFFQEGASQVIAGDPARDIKIMFTRLLHFEMYHLLFKSREEFANIKLENFPASTLERISFFEERGLFDRQEFVQLQTKLQQIIPNYGTKGTTLPDMLRAAHTDFLTWRLRADMIQNNMASHNTGFDPMALSNDERRRLLEHITVLREFLRVLNPHIQNINDRRLKLVPPILN
jgi:hypothetical protein